MLTVKNVTPEGYELIFSARHVEFRPAIAEDETPLAAEGCKGREAELWIDEGTEQQRVFSLGSGTVYVMNEHGSTVATYHLKWPKPKTRIH